VRVGSVPLTHALEAAVPDTVLTPPDAILTALRDAINSHSPARVAAAFTEDYRCELPMHPARGFQGSGQVRANWERMLGRVPDLRATVLRSVFDARTGQTWSEWEMTGSTTQGDPVVCRGVVISEARAGRISWTRFYLDEVTDL
jgi:ketosteroid isomerase-like protein